ncbi:MAG: hypothetical protein HYZ20_16095 [Burkholderiales bacterium]|nr:hypothetical protein [Burkholderiales bacterium]
MKTQTLLATLLIALGAASAHAADATADRGCDRFLGRSCTALEQAGYDRGRPAQGAEREVRRDLRSAGCDAFLGRSCSAPERAAFDAGARFATVAPRQVPNRCEEILGRTCSAQERQSFDKGRGHKLALAGRTGGER